jgi:hypothetical protein
MLARIIREAACWSERKIVPKPADGVCRSPKPDPLVTRKELAAGSVWRQHGRWPSTRSDYSMTRGQTGFLNGPGKGGCR